MNTLLSETYSILTNFLPVKKLRHWKIILKIPKYSFQKLLDNTYPEESDIEDISDECIVNFVDENEIESFQHLYLKILNTEIKHVNLSRKTKTIF